MATLCGDPAGPDGISLQVQEDRYMTSQVRSMERRLKFLTILSAFLVILCIILIAIVRPGSRIVPRFAPAAAAVFLRIGPCRGYRRSAGSGRMTGATSMTLIASWRGSRCERAQAALNCPVVSPPSAAGRLTPDAPTAPPADKLHKLHRPGGVLADRRAERVHREHRPSVACQPAHRDQQHDQAVACLLHQGQARR